MNRPSGPGGFVALLLIFLVPAVLSPFFLRDAAQLHRPVAMVALGLVLLTGVGGLTSFGQAAFVGLGAYTTAVLTTTPDLPGWIAWAGALAVAHPAGRAGADRHWWRCLGSLTPQAVGPLPAAGHHRLGHQPVLPVRHHGVPRRPHRHQRHSGHHLFGWTLDDGEIYYLIWAFLLVAMLTTHNLLDSREGGRSGRSRAAW